MKQKILVFLALMMVIALCGTAMAENVGAIPEVSVQLSQNRFNGPGPVDVTVAVSNNSSTDMAGPCALFDPNGVRVIDFGTPTLKAGDSVTWQGTWQVTEEHLTAGRLTFVLAYHIVGDDGVIVQKQQPYGTAVVNAGAEAKLEVTRTITPTTARNGQKVYVTYTVTNTGNAPATDVTIKESSAISSSAASLGTIEPGAAVTHTFTVTMGKKTLTSRATVSWKDGSVSVEDAAIKYGDVKLTATLKADKKGGQAGEVVKLTLTLKNTGKSDIGNITVTDPVLGTIFTGESVPANSTVTLEKEVTITASADHIFIVRGTNTAGDVIETATEYISIIEVDPAKAISLSVMAEADSSTIYTKPGIVKFTVHVTNNSAVEATNVTVVSNGVKVYPYNTSSRGVTLAPGETLSFVRDVRVDIDGTFRFDANATGQLGETLTFEGNGVRIYYAPPTATPTLAPITTPAVPVTQPVPQQDSLPEVYDTAESALSIAFYALLGLAALCAVLIGVGIVGRSIANSKSDSAEDTITRAPGNDYTIAVPNRRRHYMPESEEEDVPAAEPAADETDPEPADLPSAEEVEAAITDMRETMSELYPEVAPAVEEEAPAEEAPVADAPDEEETEALYRRRRRTTQDE
ncbi:MAG: hypothetical protein IKK57_02600 [Clostridia bacterium]|nr:hypothetical protein [Clostridia bacterium]